MVENLANTRNIGRLAEEKACQFLQSQGLCLIQANYYCIHGEIDLIMQDQKDILFIEVRYRSRLDYGNAAESVNRHKQKKLIKSAMYFLQKRQWLYKVNSRFDIIAIQDIANEWQLNWIKNAFLVNN
jgi:putative endonuclease